MHPCPTRRPQWIRSSQYSGPRAIEDAPVGAFSCVCMHHRGGKIDFQAATDECICMHEQYLSWYPRHVRKRSTSSRGRPPRAPGMVSRRARSSKARSFLRWNALEGWRPAATHSSGCGLLLQVRHRSVNQAAYRPSMHSRSSVLLPQSLHLLPVEAVSPSSHPAMPQARVHGLRFEG